MWGEIYNICYQVWIWLRYEGGAHPFLFLGIAIIIVSAWILYKTEVRGR
jgi:drug/metabolite transporter superfamily protein YnfA